MLDTGMANDEQFNCILSPNNITDTLIGFTVNTGTPILNMIMNNHDKDVKDKHDI